MRTVAALSELWLGLRDHGPSVGLTLTAWFRLPDRLSYPDPRTGVNRRRGSDAEMSVRFGRIDVRALLFARIDRIPRDRLGPVLTRWIGDLAAAASATSPRLSIVALALTRTECQRRGTVLEAALVVAGATERVAVAAVEPSAGALAADGVWSTADDHQDRRLADVFARVAEAGR